MEWSAKIPSQWDWENLMMLGGKPIDNHKQIQPADWGIEADGGIENGSLYSSGGGGGGGGGGSDLGHSSSSKSSISASVDSSSNVASRTSSKFNFDTAEGSREDFSTRKELGRIDNSGTSPSFAPPGGSSTEPLIGLKLGKRTYFEDVCAGTTLKPPSFSVIPPSPAAATTTTAAATAKRSRASCQSTQTPHCQVEGCNLDLTSAKDYHRRHRVCENHSKSPKVIVAGLERRFCQQCSRFHDLSEFDEKKRSCRRRLSDHNARRRKPQPDATQFSSGRLPSFYDGTQQLNVLLNSVPFVHARPTPKPTWESAWSFKPGDAKGSLFRPAKVGGINGQLHLPTNIPNVGSSLHRDSCKLLPNKGTTTEVLHQGIEAPGGPSNLDVTTTDLPRALSLLSNNSSWETAAGLNVPASLDHLIQPNHQVPMIHAVAATQQQSWPEYWQAEQQQPAEAESRVHSSSLHNNDNHDGSSNQYQEFQLFKPPFDSAFYCNRIN